MTKIDEFIDAYSDALLYLLEARRALITHPLRGDYAFGEFLNASFCRLFIAWVVQAIEIMLQTWQERDQVGVLSQYLKEGSSNGERVDALYVALHQAGIAVDPKIFKDFLAIKYLRNTIIHGRWKITRRSGWIHVSSQQMSEDSPRSISIGYLMYIKT